MKNSNKIKMIGILISLAIISPSISYADNMTLLGNWGGGGGEIRAVANYGDLVYYGIGNVFTITSFEDPANPFTAGSVTLDDMVEDIVWKVSSGVTYVFVSGSSLWVLDVTNPTAPTLLSTTELSGYGEGLDVSGDYAYVAVGSAGMQIIDVSDPASPTSVATLAGGSGSGYAEGINVSTPYAYLGNGAGTEIFNISDPTNASLVGTLAADGWVQDAMPISNYVYTCVWSSGIDVIDVSDPTNPTYISTLSNPKNADIMFDGNYGYIATREYGVTVIDVSSPGAPTVIGTYDTDGVVRKVSFGAISMSGTQTGHVFAAEVSLLSAVNVSDPNNMSVSGAVAVAAPADGLCYSSFLSGNTAYLGYRYDVRAIDITTPSAMTELGSIHLADTAMVKKVVEKDNIVFAGTRYGGLRPIDFSDPANPVWLTTVIEDRTNDVAIAGDYVYAATANNGIGIVNVATASSPTLVGYASGSTDNGRYGEGVAAYGNTMVQSTWGALFFYDISSPESPSLQDTVALVTGSSWLSLDAGHAYVHDFDTLRIYDISDLANVTQVSAVFTDGSWDGDAFREGDFVYVNIEEGGIKVFDVTDITAPVEVASYDPLNTARAITVRDGYAYVAEKSGGFSVYSNDLVLSTDNTAELPLEFSLAQNYPNPFNPSTTISYSIAQNSHVKLEIVNLTGKTVRTLINTNVPSGNHSTVWNGRTNDGRIVTSGIYIYKISVGEITDSRKMMFLK
ncbi:MAG: T9SS type A sorting domain-containing protein [Candidatus Marinimicrobia bacterium]|jgi:hypothetical protein|nr:T9SS type A sorting domain-containing protein [Candidatus Neomarinimicrobiota bacterium]|tara:strand:+ start:1417 stop:3618 length:2202 start_codon:yes stop_codon:yes gene_type:complete